MMRRKGEIRVSIGLTAACLATMFLPTMAITSPPRTTTPDCTHPQVTCVGGYCDDITGRCQCDPGSSGPVCEMVTPPLDTYCFLVQPCRNGGRCIDVGSTSYRCECSENWLGMNCTAPNPCESGPCLNGGICQSFLEENVPKFYCNCPDYYQGQYCQEKHPCAELDCRNGDCRTRRTQEGLEAKCACRPGFTGTRCEQDIDECAAGGCLNGGTCIDTVGSFSCMCPSLTSGRYCEILIVNGSRQYTSACDSNPPCQNNGTCTTPRLPSLYECRCSPGWGGLHCETSSCTKGRGSRDYYEEYEYDYEPGRDQDLHYYDLESAYQISEDYCLFDGECSVTDTAKLPTCDCQLGYMGTRCGYRRTVIQQVQPMYGPESGGTSVTITGRNVNATDDPTIYIGGEECDFVRGNFTDLICESIPRFAALDTALNVSIYWGLTNITVHLDQTFTYKEDPSILKVEPLTSIISGGVVLTVFGNNLDSVAKPGLEVSMVYRGNVVGVFDTVCDVIQSDQMLCPTPEITLLDEEGNVQLNMGQPYKRRKRRHAFRENLQMKQTSILKWLFPLRRHVRSLLIEADPLLKLSSSHQGKMALPYIASQAVLSRHRRQDSTKVDSLLVNNEELEFYLGIRLDGVLAYRNLSESLPEYGKLKVYIDPNFFRWEEEVVITNTDERQLDILGEHLDVGLASSDYSVQIGKSLCENVLVFNNRIICTAPDTEPERDELLDTEDKYRVRVHIGTGKVKFLVGDIKYNLPKSFFDNPAAKWGIIGGAIALAAIIIIVIAVCVIRNRS